MGAQKQSLKQEQLKRKRSSAGGSGLSQIQKAGIETRGVGIQATSPERNTHWKKIVRKRFGLAQMFRDPI